MVTEHQMIYNKSLISISSRTVKGHRVLLYERTRVLNAMPPFNT